MKKEQKNSKNTTGQSNRRQFLKNTSFAGLSLGFLGRIESQAAVPLMKKKTGLLCDKTTLDYYGEGPFYTENPPFMSDGQLAKSTETGQRLLISGRVFNLDCSEYIPNTIIDVWHADESGDYDNTGYNLRGVTQSNDQGFYVFETIYPGKYLNGSQYRPSHIHFKITPPGFNTLTTQLYFEGDPDLETDAASSIKSGQFDATHRIIPLTTNEQGVLEGTWDININGQGLGVGLQDLHIDKGMIYQSQPNPFSDSLEIKYGVFRPAIISLQVYDIQGRTIAVLEERKLNSGKYTALWVPDKALPNGHYFIALKINDLQVHYLKVQKLG